MTLTAGIDIGGSNVTAVVRDESGQIVDRYHEAASSSGGRQVAASAVRACHALDVDHWDAIGIGVPGQVDPETGRVRMAVNLGIGSEPFNLAGEVAAALGCPVAIENDVRAAALGAYESYEIDGHRPHSLALVNIGTGISAGVVMDGSLLRGAHGMAGEIGHVVVDETGPVCRCGQRGCLETVAAGPAIARAWPAQRQATAAAALFTAAAEGDSAAETVAERIIDYLVTALIWLAATYDPELFVLAGGVSEAGPAFLEETKTQISRHGATSELAARRLRPDQVSLANRADPPGPRGAAVLAADHLHRTLGVPSGASPSNKYTTNQQGGAA